MRVGRVGRVLIVDDEPAIGRALRRWLSDRYVVETLTDASIALHRLESGERYDVVLCDLMMPVMDGIEFHRRLSETVPEEARRVVFISGGAITARVESFIRRTPNLLLEKPLDLPALVALIERRTSSDDAEPPSSAVGA